MGALGFDDLKEQVKYRLGMDTSPETVGNDSLNFYGIWVNHAYKQICSSNRLFGMKQAYFIPQLETSLDRTTVAGTASVLDPADAIIVRTAYDATNNTKLEFIAYRKYLTYTDKATTAARQKPREWTRAGGFVYLYPTPDSAYTVTLYYKYLPVNLEGTNVTDIGAEWDEPIVQLASYKGQMWLGQFDRAKATKEEFLETVSGIISLYRSEEMDTNIKIGPTDSYYQMR